MRNTLKILPLMLGIVLFFTQCEKEAIEKGSVETLIELKSDEACSVTQTLWAGAGRNDTLKGTDVGSVTATVVGNTLVVEYAVEAPWYLTETHLWVGKNISDIPRQAAPGRFPFKANLDFESGWSQVVNLASLGINPGDPIYVAAHGVVVEGFAGLEGLQEALPNMAKFSIQLDMDVTYLKTTVSDANILNGEHYSYCINSGTFITPGTIYDALVYSSYVLPESFSKVDKPGNFPMVNWIINFIEVGDEYSYADVQRAIWELLENNPVDIANPPLPYDLDKVAEIIAAAEAYQNEEGEFVPECGQYLVIVLDPIPPVQPVIIWKPISCGGEETVWAFGDYTFIDNGIARKWGWIFDLDCY